MNTVQSKHSIFVKVIIILHGHALLFFRFCIILTSNERVEYVPKIVLRPNKEVQLNLIPLQKDM